MAGPRRAVCVLILFNMYEVPVEVRNKDRQGCSICNTLIARTFDGVGGVCAGIYDWQVRLFTRRAKLIGTWLAKQQIAIDFLFGDFHARGMPLNNDVQTVLIRTASDGSLEISSKMTT